MSRNELDAFPRERRRGENGDPEPGHLRAVRRHEQNCRGRNLQLRDSLRAIARRRETSVSTIAVAWTLAWKGVTGAIVGARSPTQVDGWIRAGSLVLTGQELDEIDSAIRDTRAGVGPLRQAR